MTFLHISARKLDGFGQKLAEERRGEKCRYKIFGDSTLGV